MLNHPHRQRRQVEHLPPLHTYFRRLRQISATPHARARLVPHPLLRVLDQRQRRPPISRLAARLATALATRGLRSGLDERRIRRRRLRPVPAVRPLLPPQLGDLSLQPRDPLGLSQDKDSKLLVGRTSISGHPTISNTLRPRSTRRADQTVPSYVPTSSAHSLRGFKSYRHGCQALKRWMNPRVYAVFSIPVLWYLRVRPARSDLPSYYWWRCKKPCQRERADVVLPDQLLTAHTELTGLSVYVGYVPSWSSAEQELCPSGLAANADRRFTRTPPQAWKNHHRPPPPADSPGLKGRGH